MNDNLLFVINQYIDATVKMSINQRKIVEILCDTVRDIIPDIKGRFDIVDTPNVMFLHSESRGGDFPEDREGMEFASWYNISRLIEDVFPEIEFMIKDNGISLSQEEEKKILERLKKLRDSMEGEKKC